METELLSENYLPNVRDQYETYPYPPRKEDDLCSTGELLELLNHVCYKGKQQYKEFRILVAGCGTGDSVVWLGHQLREYKPYILAVDISQTTLDICKSRVEYQKLENVDLKQMSLLDLPTLDTEPFDYINCSGVLHHLKDPTEGLQALSDVLKPEGSLSILIYAKYGRTGVYQIQDMMRMINTNETDMQKKVDRTREILKKLPQTNWFSHQYYWFTDHMSYGDVGTYDLLLHSQDRCYDVEELYEYVESCGLNITMFDPQYAAKYNLENTEIDKEILEAVKQLPLRKQQHLGEIFQGNIIKHVFFASKSKETMARLDEFENIPMYMLPMPDGYIETFVEGCEKTNDGSNIVSVPMVMGNKQKEHMKFEYNKYLKYIFRYIDGTRTLEEIFNNVRKDINNRDDDDNKDDDNKDDDEVTNEELIDNFKEAYNKLVEYGVLLLRHKSVPVFAYSKQIKVYNKMMFMQTLMDKQLEDSPKLDKDVLKKIEGTHEFKKLIDIINGTNVNTNANTNNKKNTGKRKRNRKRYRNR